MKNLNIAMEDISKSSEETAKIAKTIDEIAFQTNMLALNAAVEAARAGEAGKGFAVVAEEVRNLAQRSAEASKSTSTLIEESVKKAEGGVRIAKESTEAFEKINDGVGKVNDLVAEIAAASNEQSQGIEQINTAIGQMDQVTQSSAANAEESASAAEQLNAQAEELHNMTDEFTVSNAAAGRSSTTKAKRHGAASKKHSPEQHMPGGVASPKRLGAMSAKKAASPEEAIPMEDNAELEKF